MAVSRRPLNTDGARISVALCTHNGSAYVADQIRSILAQTLPVHEIVLGDDESSDDTVAIVRQLVDASDVDLIVREHRPGLGVRGNFADAISATTGDIVALSDQDDVWHADRLATLVPHLTDRDLVHSDARLVDSTLQPLGETLLRSLEATEWELDSLTSGEALPVLLRRNLVTGATVVMRGDFARAALPVPDGWLHDEWLAMLAAIDGGVKLVPEALTDYRQHDSNEVGARRMSLVDKWKLLREQGSGAHRRKALRATTLAQAAFDRDLGDEETRTLLVAKARHERTRLGLPTWYPARVPAIARGLVQGRYGSFSRGSLEAVRDLLERR